MKNGRAPTDITLDITVTHHDPADTCQPRSRRRGELRREAILRLWRSIVEQTAAWSSTCRGRWWGAATTSTSTHPCPQTNANSSWFLRRLGGREVRSSPTHIIRVANDGGSQRMAARSTHRYTRRFVEETSEKMVSKKMRALILQISTATNGGNRDRSRKTGMSVTKLVVAVSLAQSEVGLKTAQFSGD